MKILPFKHIGLFEGIGGFSLAARWIGWETVAWCEWSPFGQQVLRHHFPEAEGHGDITKTCFKKYANQIDILTGGFPCQPYSLAGKRLGKEDERHLWPEMRRAVRETAPRYVVGENVAGLISWDGGLVFDEVQTDLENEGYEVWAYVLPACGVGAPHRRDRVWFIAKNTDYIRRHGFERQNESGFGEFGFARAGNNERVRGKTQRSYSNGTNSRAESLQKRENEIHGFTPSSNTERLGQSRSGRPIESSNPTPDGNWKASWAYNDGRWPTESPICRRDDGIPSGLAGITVSKHRNESIKAYGNAIVPQVAFEIFKTVQEIENNFHKTIF